MTGILLDTEGTEVKTFFKNCLHGVYILGTT